MPGSVIERFGRYGLATDPHLRAIDRDYHIRLVAESQQDLVQLQAAQIALPAHHAAAYLRSAEAAAAQRERTNQLLDRVSDELSGLVASSQAMEATLAAIAAGHAEYGPGTHRETSSHPPGD